MMALVPSHSYSSSSSLLKLAASTISAAPSFLPDSPLTSQPELSPDITPLFPSAGGSVPSTPTIPSSPSPPNPDDMATSTPANSVLSPAPSQPMSSSTSLYLAGLPNSILSLGLLVFWSFWFLQLSAK
ncbi:hypothetical protein NE237_011895 [Protea cynaroides]|uniref:Classical arabinogalactan protein 26-like n=1 Tax=Protea cynaroides TaxID=273540 RepID=A0A9Q0JXI1_9MAGN|nr:hypothetical protein NE237_011895 [Protea cynaroides]